MGPVSHDLFLSAVSSEFSSYREKLDQELSSYFHIATQEVLAQGGGKLLETLHDHIHGCCVVVQLIGDACGHVPKPAEVARIRERCPDLLPDQPDLRNLILPHIDSLSYTQWEGILALHYRKPCLFFRPDSTVDVPRNRGFTSDAEERLSQQRYFEFLRSVGEHHGTFSGPDDLVGQLWKALAKAGLLRKRTSIWKVPQGLQRNKHFTGRDDLINSMRRAFESGSTSSEQTLVLAGLGGVGKTQVALEYCHRYREKYSIVAWLPAAQPKQLEQEYVSLAPELIGSEIYGSAGASSHRLFSAPNAGSVADAGGATSRDRAEELKSAVRQWFDANSRWLLVFDDVDNPRDLENYLPQTQHRNVIITTQNRTCERLGTLFPLGVWPKPQATQFLLSRTGSDDEKAAAAVAEAVHCLPLALAQAAAYVVDNNESLARYLALYRACSLGVFDPRYEDDHLPGYQKTVRTTWKLALARIREISPESIDVLKLLAFFAPDEIPENVLYSDDTIRPGGEVAEAGILRWNEVIRPLKRYSLLEESEGKLSVHGLVQTVVRTDLTRDEQQHLVGRALELVTAALSEADADSPPTRASGELLPHARTVAGHADRMRCHPVASAFLLKRVAAHLQACADFAGAAQSLEDARSQLERADARSYVEVVELLTSQGKAHRLRGDHALAEEILLKSLRRLESEPSLSLPHLAAVHLELGLLFLDDERGNLSRAEQHLGESLALYTALDDHRSALRAQLQLGEYHTRTGQYREAIELLEGVRSRLELEGASDSLEVGEVLYSLGEAQGYLGRIEQSQDRCEEAERLFRRVLGIRERHYGRGHPLTMEALHNLAFMLRSHSSEDRAAHLQALEYYREVFSCHRRYVGPEHRNYLTTLGEQIRTMRDLRRNDDLLELVIEQLETVGLISSIHFPDLIRLLRDETRRLATEGRQADARAALERGVRAHRIPQVRRTELQLDLAGMYESAGLFEPMLKLYEAAFADLAATPPGEQKQHEWLKTIAGSFAMHAAIERAEAVYQEAIRRFPADSNLLGVHAFFVAYRTGDLSRACAEFESALAIEDTDANLIANFAAVRIAQGNEDAAAELLTRAGDLVAPLRSRKAAKVLYLRALLADLRGETSTDYLAAFKALARDGFERIDWPLGFLLGRVAARLGREKVTLYETLASAFGDPAVAVRLPDCESWVALTSIPVD